jgi:hypothetical protein
MKEVLLSEATSADPGDLVAVGHGGLFGSCVSCGLGGMGCIFSCLTPKLPIAGGSNLLIPSPFVFIGPREDRESNRRKVVFVRRWKGIVTQTVFITALRILVSNLCRNLEEPREWRCCDR